MKRACKVSLKFITAKKQRQINTLLSSYSSAVNFYIKSIWKEKGKLDYKTVNRLTKSRLSQRYKTEALKQALEMVVFTKKSAKTIKKQCSMPVFKGSATLDYRFISIEEGKGSFDLALRLACLKKGYPITIPTRHTKMTRKWLSKSNAKFVKGCSLSEKGITLWVDIPEQGLKNEGNILGIDLGINKLISDSDGKHYGKDFKTLSSKIRRKKPKSKAKQRVLKERNNYIGKVVNQSPWNELKTIGIEELKNIKFGKKKGRSKSFRKAMIPWVISQVVDRIENKASENRIHLIKVNPRNTSITCPECSKVSKENRRGEEFLCIFCNYAGDADSVGAKNILVKTLETLGNLQLPRQLKEVA